MEGIITFLVHEAGRLAGWLGGLVPGWVTDKVAGWVNARKKWKSDELAVNMI